MAVLAPGEVTLALILWLETVLFEQTFRKAERHGGIVGPLAGLQVEGTAADDVVDGRELAGGGEFKGGAKGIAGGEAKQATEVAVEGGGGHGW